ncbi:hypothetical protein [Litorimonas sp. WD9-15]|uniref:hypothetical protein n=1 Tax=Litorimonas sp. WD9-15 TaxID=3418716 RepID=UPI003D03AADA
MLMKALLTGGILSVLAGSIVYFGTEGAVATEADEDVRVELNGSELAGGKTTVTETRNTTETVTIETVEASDPPKTKFLDQYLKSDKKKVEEEKPEPKAEAEPEMKKSKPSSAKTYKSEAKTEAEPEKKKTTGSRTREDIIRMMNGAAKRPVTDQNIIDAARKDGPGSGFLPSDVMEKKIETARGTKVDTPQQSLPSKGGNYDRVLDEARKLQVTDMRNQALLEVIDYAIDRGDMGQAADIVGELSTPELRDTARSRIGTGLAKRGNADAAFAVLDEIEIDELAAPIRLEIITILTATRQERANMMRKYSE